jgi:hypothetical protein
MVSQNGVPTTQARTEHCSFGVKQSLTKAITLAMRSHRPIWNTLRDIETSRLFESSRMCPKTFHGISEQQGQKARTQPTRFNPSRYQGLHQEVENAQKPNASSRGAPSTSRSSPHKSFIPNMLI